MSDISPETLALRQALDAARTQAATERNLRQEAEGRLRQETGNRFAAQETAVETALSQAETNANRLQADWEKFQAEGDFSNAGKAMREMTETTARIAQLRGEKEYYARQKQQAAAAPADPLANFNPAEREWIAKNPRYAEDQTFARKVNAAATHAVEFEGLVKDSPEYWQHIERKVYPERFQQQQQRDPDAQGNGNDAPAGDTGEGGDALEQQHTMNTPISHPTVDAPVMKIDLEKPAEPQPRAVGKGGEGMRAVAAPPSRRIQEASNRLVGGAPRIEPTQQEWEVAQALYDSIEPNATDRTPETIVRWYHALYNSPSHQKTRRRHWVNA